MLDYKGIHGWEIVLESQKYKIVRGMLIQNSINICPKELSQFCHCYFLLKHFLAFAIFPEPSVLLLKDFHSQVNFRSDRGLFETCQAPLSEYNAMGVSAVILHFNAC